MAFYRLYLIIVLLSLVLSVEGNVIRTTPVTMKSEIRPLTGPLLTKLTSPTTQTTRPTSDSSSQPVITTEFKRGQYKICCAVSCCDVNEYVLLDFWRYTCTVI